MEQGKTISKLLSELVEAYIGTRRPEDVVNLNPRPSIPARSIWWLRKTANDLQSEYHTLAYGILYAPDELIRL
mgnify:FL=1